MLSYKIHYVATFLTSRLVLRRISITEYLYSIASESSQESPLVIGPNYDQSEQSTQNLDQSGWRNVVATDRLTDRQTYKAE